MKIRYSPGFYQRYKKLDVRVCKSFDEKIKTFLKDPYDLQLDNHVLKKKWAGYRSIDITVDYRAIYEETHEEEDIIAYFVALGTHDELYKEP